MTSFLQYFSFAYYKEPKKCFNLVVILLTIAYILNAIFSIGWYFPDEHWQILEFANYKLGTGIPSDLAWEYHSQMRPSFQVFVAYLTVKIFNIIGIENRYSITTFLRFVSGFCTLSVLLLLLNFSYKKIKYDLFKNIATCFALAWFIPFYGVHFASESFTAIFFLLGIYLFLKTSFRSIGSAISIGFLFCLAFESRYQTAFLILGFYAWVFVYHTRFKFTLPLISSVIIFLLGILACTLTLDYWLYNKVVCAPFNYFYENIFLNKVANFGKESAFIYLFHSMEVFILPYGIIIIGLFLFSFYLLRHHLFTWCIVLFILAHCLISHKELRFLFPLIWFIPVFVAEILIKIESIPPLFEKVTLFLSKPKIITALKFYFVFNFIILFSKSVLPANVDDYIMKYIYDRTVYSQNTTHLLNGFRGSPYRLGEYGVLTATFYKPKNIQEYFTNMDNDTTVLESTKNAIDSMKQAGVKEFYWLVKHSHFYMGDSIPMPKVYWQLDLYKTCKVEHNIFQDWKINYNPYRYVRWGIYTPTLYKCSL